MRESRWSEPCRRATGRAVRVFLAGATGTLGRPTVRALVAAGHGVRGVARGSAKADVVRADGREPVEVSLFDVDALRSALRGCDAVLHFATKIPPLGRIMRSNFAENDRLRRDGSRCLVDAAQAAGVATEAESARSRPPSSSPPRERRDQQPHEALRTTPRGGLGKGRPPGASGMNVWQEQDPETKVGPPPAPEHPRGPPQPALSWPLSHSPTTPTLTPVTATFSCRLPAQSKKHCSPGCPAPSSHCCA